MADSYGRKKEMNFIAFKLILLQISKETVCPCFISVELNLSLRRNDGFETVHTHLLWVFSAPSNLLHRSEHLHASFFIHSWVCDYPRSISIRESALVAALLSPAVVKKVEFTPSRRFSLLLAAIHFRSIMSFGAPLFNICFTKTQLLNYGLVETGAWSLCVSE